MSSSSMSPSNGVVLATAMAVSGTVILLAMRLQKSLTTTTPAATTTTTPTTTTTTTQFLISPVQQLPAPRSCISPDGRKREKKKKKKVHFAQDVVDTRGSSEEFRRRMRSSDETSLHSSLKNGRKIRDMPANRMALYNGMLKDRVLHRVAYSY